MQDRLSEKSPPSDSHLAALDRSKASHDDGLAVVVQNIDEATTFTEEERKMVLRKIDLFLMPLMSVTVLLQFLDKTSLNYANLLGIKADMNLHGQQYSWLGSIFYFGYLGASPIHGYFLQKAHLTKYTACNVIVWGACLALHAAAYNYAGIVVCRLFLGILEAGITPAFILLTGRFYRRQEQVSRTGIWFSMNGWAQILGGVISWAILGRTSTGTSLKRWQELFLILGSVTMFFGIVLFFVMPASPADTKYFNETERKIAIERIRDNKTGINDKEFKKYQLVEALKDVKLYLFSLGVLAANISNGGVTNFGTAIISGFGFSPRQTALIGMSTGGAEIVAVMLGIALAAWSKTRVVPGVFSFLVAIVGGILMIALPASNKAGRMAGYAIVYWYPVASPFYYSWLSSCIGGSTKKIVFNVFLQVGYCVGNIIGPQTYRTQDAPGYIPAKATLIAMFVVSSICLICISVVHLRDNRSRDRKQEFGADEPKNVEFMDWTDREMRSFRYPY